MGNTRTNVWSSISNPVQESAISEERHLCLGDTGGVHHLLVPGAHILPLSATRKPGGPHWLLGTRQAWESYQLRRPGESACTFSYPSPPQQPPATQATRRAAPPNDGRPPPRAPRPPGSASNERPAGAGRAGSLSSWGRDWSRAGAREKQVPARAAQPQARELRWRAEGRSPREPGTAASERAGFAPGQARSEVRAMGEEKYLPELMAEKDSLDPSFVHASRLLAEGRTGPGARQPWAGRSWGGWTLRCAETVPRSCLWWQEHCAGSRDPPRLNCWRPKPWGLMSGGCDLLGSWTGKPASVRWSTGTFSVHRSQGNQFRRKCDPWNVFLRASWSQISVIYLVHFSPFGVSK